MTLMMKPAYYNDNDPYCAQWLRNLIAAGHLPAGEVDERPIQSVRGSDLGRFGQCHFFAGIGGWALALAMSKWPQEFDVWTGSCPCQPFSAAGKRRGTSDERHLWPEFARLIGECRPATVLGEQVASKAGREWLAGVFADLEGMAYAVAGADLCAASVGAPHIRQRLYWVADSAAKGLEGAAGAGLQGRRDRSASSSPTRRLADADGGIAGDRRVQPSRQYGQQPQAGRDERGHGADERTAWTSSVVIQCADGKTRRVEPSIFPLAHAGEWGAGSRVGILRGAGNAIAPPLAAEFIKAVMECMPTTGGLS